MRRSEVDGKQAGALPFKDRIDGCEGVRWKSAIRVQEQQIVVLCGLGPGVHLRSAAAWRLQDARAGGASNRHGGICAASVDDDDFGDLVEYIQVGERFRKGTLLEECRNDDAEWAGRGSVMGRQGRRFASRGSLC